MSSAITRLLLACLAGVALASHAQTRLEPRLATNPAHIIPVNRIVAVVNDEVITQNDLTERVNLLTKQLQRQGSQLPASDVLSRQILASAPKGGQDLRLVDRVAVVEVDDGRENLGHDSALKWLRVYGTR